MRTGAIFARGSCQALKWMALFGVVFALGAGSAAAQILKVTVPDTREDAGVVPVTVEVDPNGQDPDNSFEVTLTLATDATKAPDLQGETGADTNNLYGVGASGPADVSWEGIARGTASPTVLTFAWGDSGETQSHTVRLRTHRDPDAEDEYFTVTASTSETDNGGGAISDASDGFMVDDREEQTFVLRRLLSTAGDVEMDEGDTETFELEAVPLKTAPVELRVTLDSTEDDSDYSLSPNLNSISQNFTIPPASSTGQTGGTIPVPFTTEDNDIDRVDDTVTLTAYWITPAERRGDEATSLTVTVIDQHKLPPVMISKIQVPDADDKLQDAMTIPEGTMGTVTLVADRGTSTDDVPDTEDITVTLTHVDSSTAARADYTLSGSPVSIDAAPGRSGTGTFDLDVDADEDVGEESLVLLATVAGEKEFGPNPDAPYNLDAVAFSDQTAKKIEARTMEEVYAALAEARDAGDGDNNLWEPGESMTLMADKLFKGPPTTTRIGISNAVSDDPAILTAASSGAMVTLTAVASGETEVEITGTVTAESSGFMATQTVSNVATIKFKVMVDAPAISAMPQADVDAAVAAAVKEAADMASSKQWEPGGATAMVPLSDLFDVPDSIRAIYDAASSDMGDIEAGISSDKMHVTLVPKSAGTAMITVTAADTASGGGTTASVSFDATVMAQAAIVAKSQADVNKVFMDAGAGELVAGGSAVMVDMSDLFTVAPGVTPTYTTQSSAAAVGANASGTMLTLTPVSAGSAKITVTATSGDNTATVSADVTVGLSDLTVTVTAEPVEIMEGATATVTATASRPVAAADGEVKIELDVVGDATLDMESITIAAGSSDGSVTLTATEDDDDYENETVVVIASGSGISGATRITITVEDNDEAPGSTIRAMDNAADLIAAAVDAVAGGAEWMVGGMVAQVDMSTLFEVDEGVTPIYAGTSSADAVTASSSGNMLMLTPAAAGTATITVTASDSAGGSSASVSADVTVALQALVVTVTASANAVDEGGSVTLTAKANRDVTADHEVSLQVAGDAAAVEVADSITIAAGADMGEATLMAVEDDDTQNANVTVVASGAGIATPITMDIAVTDNDRTVNAKSQADVDTVFVTAIGGDFLPGGAAVTVDMSTLFTTNGNPSVGYTTESSNAESVTASASGSMLTLTPVASGTAMISVTATDSTGDSDDTATVSYNATVGVLPLEVTVTPPTAEVTEGGTVEITATANKMVDANVEVMLIRDAASSASANDYSLAPSAMITIMAGEVSGMTTLTATDDRDVEGAETLTLVARVKDLGDVGTVAVSITDNDMLSTYTLSGGPADSNLVEGMSYELTVTADPAVQVETTVMIMRDGTSSAGDADFEVGEVTIAAGSATGTTTLMAVEDSMAEDMEMLVLYGMEGNQRTENSLSFNIWDAAVPALPIIAQLLLAAFLAIGGYRRYLRR